MLQVSGVKNGAAGSLAVSGFSFPIGEERLMNMATSSAPGARATVALDSGIFLASELQRTLKII